MIATLNLRDRIVGLEREVPLLDGRRVPYVNLDNAASTPALVDVARAVEVIDAADMGDEEAEFVLGDAEDHQLAWYATQEIPFLLEFL